MLQLLPGILSFGVTGAVVAFTLIFGFATVVVIMALHGSTPEQRPGILRALAVLFRAIFRRP